MAMTTIQFTYETDDGDEIEAELPARFEVCGSCEGHGTHLNPSIGQHAYTAEEFYESFDEEQAAEYFKRGGRYDVTCEECQGKRVVAVVNLTEAECRSAEQREALAAYKRKQRDDWEYERECAAERRMGC